MAFNRAEANNAFNTQMLRELSADPLVLKRTRVDSLKGLVDLMDELNECRELASLHLGYEPPGYDMRLIRAAVAGNTPNNPAPNADEEPAPDDKVNGL